MRREQRRVLLEWTVVLVLLVGGCSAAPLTRSQQVGSGEPEIGRRLLSDYGCVSCHVVPGIDAEPAYVGPPLDHWGKRSYIAGALSNNEQNLVRWITGPQDVEPGTAMPDLDVSEQDATNIAAYLLSLE
jgi:cytochrome c